MKIVQVSPYAMDRPGGVQAHVRDLSEWLRCEGHEVHIVAPKGNTASDHYLTPGGCRTITMHGTSFELSRARAKDLRACVAELKEWGAELVHLHTPWTPMLAWQIWRALKLPTVATFHATLPEGTGFDPFRWYIRLAARYFHKRLHLCVVPSNAPLQQWRDLGVSPEPLVLPPVVNLDRWKRANTHNDHDLHLVFMGRLEERKGAQVLLEAWPNIKRALPNARLTIAGAGELEQTLKEHARDRCLEGIQFASPPSDTEAPNLVASADFFVAPATGGESFGLVLVEAMAAGTLPIAAANAGYATVMTGKGADLLVPARDAEALAQKVINLSPDKMRRADLQAWAKTCADGYDVETWGPSFLSLYKDVLN